MEDKLSFCEKCFNFIEKLIYQVTPLDLEQKLDIKAKYFGLDQKQNCEVESTFSSNIPELRANTGFWSIFLELRTFVTHNLEKDPGSKKVQLKLGA